MKIDSQEKVPREALKEVKNIGPLLDSHNTLIETVNNLADKNIDIDNLQALIIDTSISTGAGGVSASNPIRFKIDLGVKVRGVTLLQCVEKATFTPIEAAGCPAWEEINGEIIIKSMAGLSLNKVYLLRYYVQ